MELPYDAPVVGCYVIFTWCPWIKTLKEYAKCYTMDTSPDEALPKLENSARELS
jgi:hypothetical protein